MSKNCLERDAKEEVKLRYMKEAKRTETDRKSMAFYFFKQRIKKIDE